MKVRHLKTGNIYEVLGEAINATNEHTGQLMVLYFRDDKTYVRKTAEFWEKFEKVVPLSEVLTCQDCKTTEGVFETTCPYASEVNGRDEYVAVCQNCYQERAWEV